MTEIRSFRRVFDLERRVYSIDRLRLNPGGIPVRGIVYLLAILALVLVAARLPLIGTLVGLLPWYLRDLAIPGASATVLSVIRIEGRTFHLAAQALLRHGVAPRHLAGLSRRASTGEAWSPAEIVMLPDGSDARMRDLRYTGPGAVLVAIEHERRGRAVERDSVGRARPRLRALGGPALVLRERDGGGALRQAQVISLLDGVALRVRPGRHMRR